MEKGKYSWLGFKIGLFGIIIGAIPIALMFMDEYFGIGSLRLDILERTLAILAILIVVCGGVLHSKRKN